MRKYVVPQEHPKGGLTMRFDDGHQFVAGDFARDPTFDNLAGVAVRPEPVTVIDNASSVLP